MFYTEVKALKPVGQTDSLRFFLDDRNGYLMVKGKTNVLDKLHNSAVDMCIIENAGFIL
jgi:hypothetical protein